MRRLLRPEVRVSSFVVPVLAASAAFASCTPETGVPPAADAAADGAPDRVVPGDDARAPVDAGRDVGEPARDATVGDGGDAAIADGASDASDGGGDAADGGADASDASDGGADAADAASDASDGGGDAADAGPFTVLATGVPFVNELVVGGGYVYFTHGSGALSRVSTGGGGATSITLPSQHSPTLLAVDAANLYFATSGGEAWRIAHGSTSSTRLAYAFTLGAPTQIASDGTYLYWGQQDGLVARIPVAPTVPSDGGGAALAVVQYASGVVPAGGSLYIGEHGPTNAGQIDVLLADGGVQPIATSLYATGPTRLTTDGHRVYFVEGTSGSTPIESVALDGGALRRYASSVQYARIATDGTSLYYMSGAVNGAAVVKGPVDGTGGTVVSMTTLYASLGYTSSSLAVDATHLYWGDYTNGIVYKAPK